MNMKVIIIGAGEVGYHIADSLSREGIDTVVIDRNEERLHEISEALDVQTVLGSGSSPESLKRAGMAQADMVIAVTDSDETNMIACLLASTQSRIPIRIARIRNVELNGDGSLFGTDRLNIDLCINPEREAVSNVMDLLEFPGAAEVFSFAGGRIRLLGFQIDADAVVIGKKLSDLRAMEPGFKVLITAIIRDEKLIVPSGGSFIEGGDYIFAVTDATRVRELLRFFGKNTEPPRRVIIIGGGNTGMMLALAIEKRNIAVKLIEKKRVQCEFLASHLDKTVVLRGDGTSHELLREENIEGTDFFIAVTNDEEANILGALIAKQLGARKVISLINRIDYIPLVSRVGIDGVINPRHAAISRILHYIRKGKVISATPLRDEKAEAFEFIALETSEITDRPFKEIHFPSGTIVGAICRGEEIIIPDGDSVIRSGDHVVIFTPCSAIGELEKLLTVKLEYFG
ncbi:MAG: Trk system potassium transporter TrkA [Proteobacteria bacterium]|nr:Trk system potassium transporter TrkA [Pseudomonadota bacterium]MBU4583136.1 Trk system potassium transporter TrkA [Pseudomonadota bacterium]MCG2740562.1 Trk system potassium transporter TrkA [Syntrophaceae bacterium]